MARWQTLLWRIFRPVFLPMDHPTDFDPIRHQLDAAIDEHERAGKAEREGYSSRLDAAIEDVLRKIGRSPEKESRSDG